MKDRVVSYKWYAVWEYEKEEEDLNEASKKGLQLTKGGCFHRVFQRNDSVRYIYQLDYNRKVKDKERYKEIFEEQGWEYVNSTFNGWHYFKKIYKEGMSADEIVIYTDRESLYEMQSRWMRLMKTFAIIFTLMMIVYTIGGIMTHHNPIIIEGLVIGLMGLTMGLGVRSANQKRQGKKESFYIKMQWVFPVAVIILVAILIYSFFSPTDVFNENFNYIGMAQDSLPRSSGEIEIKKDGIYYLDLDFKVGNGTMMISMQDEKGQEVYKNVADRCSVNDWKLDLKAGTYKIYYAYSLDDQPASKVDAMAEVKITN